MKFYSTNSPMLSSELEGLFAEAPKLSQDEFIQKVYDMAPWLCSLVGLAETFISLKNLNDKGQLVGEKEQVAKGMMTTALTNYQQEYAKVIQDFKVQRAK